jgi:O-acetyl-ADP-ribose deacetylase (regulator of RNase III)
MDGGVDLVFLSKYGLAFQERLQKHIEEDFEGELLVGQSIVLPTGWEKQPALIYTPTMRVPRVIPDPNSIYLAARSAARIALKLGAKKIVTPGLGTLTGGMRPEWAVNMMKAGFEDALKPREFPKSLTAASDWHAEPYTLQAPQT